MDIIDHKIVIEDSDLVERIVTVPGYQFIECEDPVRNYDSDLTIVLWNWWISN